MIALFILVLAAGVLVATILAGLTWPHRRIPGAWLLFIILLALNVWLSGKVFELLVTSLSAKVFWANVQYFGIVVLPPAFLTLALEINGRVGIARARLFRALCVVPLITTLIIWTNEAHLFFRTSVELSPLGPILVISATHGWWFYVHTVYSYTLILIAVVMFFRAGLVTDRRGRVESLLFVAAALSPLIFNLLFLFRMFHRWPLDITPFSLLLSALLLFVVILKYPFYDVVRLAWNQFAQTASNVLVIINADNRVVGLTRSAETLMDRSVSSPVGRTIAEVVPEIAAAVAGVPESEAFRCETSLSVDEGQRIFDLEIRPVVGGTSGRLPGRIISLYDITRLKEQEKTVAAQQAFQEMVADVEALFVDADENTTDATINAALQRIGEHFAADRGDMFILTTDQITASNTHEWCRPGVGSKRLLLQDVSGDQTPWYKDQILDHGVPVCISDVDLMPCEASVEQAILREFGVRAAVSIPLRSKERILGFLGLDLEYPYAWKDWEIRGLVLIARIIADSLLRARTMRELVELESKSNAARQEAETANRAKSEFLASMSHELRTPLNAILGFSQLLRNDDELSAQQRDFAGEVVTAGKHLLSLVNEVLDLSRIERGYVDLSIEPVSCADILSESVKMIKPFAEKHRIRLETEPPVELHIQADQVRVKQVLLNLLSNAVKYNRAGGSVAVACSRRDDTVRISVTDTGEGIPEERTGELFANFSRLGREGGTIKGSGIGLALSRRLVELMDGTIGVESVVGEGSTFWIELPLSEESGRSPEGKAGAPGSEAGARVAGETQTTVLYIDDNPAATRLMERVLAGHGGYRLISAHTGSLGVELAAVERPQVILVDINLPGINGYEVLRRVRGSEWGAQVPVIAMSADAMEGAVKRGEAAGFAAYITKPVDIRGFLATLDGITGGSSL